MANYDINPQEDTFRMDRAIVVKENIDSLYNMTGDHIAEMILYYICNEHQYNIFGYGILDPEEFGKRFGFSRQYLNEKHPSPFQFQLDKKHRNKTNLLHERFEGSRSINNVVCDTRLMNSLLVLGSLNLVTNTSYEDEGKIYYKTDFIKTLNSIILIQDKTTGKIKIGYQLDTELRKNLSNIFSMLKISSLIKLRTIGLNPLYAFLIRFRTALFREGLDKNTIDNAPQFDYLCSIAYIQENQENRLKKKDLNKALKAINERTELHFTVTWINKEGEALNKKYTPIFQFEVPDSSMIAKKNSYAYSVYKNKESVEIASNIFKHKLYSLCPLRFDNFSDDAEEQFLSWLCKIDNLTKEKIKLALMNTFAEINCNIPDDIDKRIEDFCLNASTQDSMNFDSWVEKIFSFPHKFTFKPVLRKNEDETPKKSGALSRK